MYIESSRIYPKRPRLDWLYLKGGLVDDKIPAENHSHGPDRRKSVMLQREMDFRGRVDCESPNDVSSPSETRGACA